MGRAGRAAWLFCAGAVLVAAAGGVGAVVEPDLMSDEDLLQAVHDEFVSENPFEDGVDEGLLDALDEATESGAAAAVPNNYAQSFRMPSKYANIRRYCSHLNRVKDDTLTKLYEQAYPLTGKIPHGCNPGCLIGTSRGATSARGPQGSNNAEWTGKCFYPEQNMVKNQLEVDPWYAFGFKGDWNHLEAFPAETYTGESWFNRTEEAIIIDYTNTPRQHGKSFNCYQDEMREISPGFFLGRLYAKPFSYCDRFNPLPYPYFVLHFAVFQAPIVTGEDITDLPIQGFSGPHL